MLLSDSFIRYAVFLGVTANLLVICLSCICRRKQVQHLQVSDPSFRAFQHTYLAGYLTATMADWIQGPYLYALYQSYGYSRKASAGFFMIGFCSSTVLGTFLGMLADRYGRRKFAMLYCILYIFGCLAKHVNHASVLLVGHAAAGAAISLLYCVFDSWLVAEHVRNGFEQDLLSDTFTKALFCNSIVAVVAGEIGQLAVDFIPVVQLRLHPSFVIHFGGYCSPFDVAILLLIACIGLIIMKWQENYGESESCKGQWDAARSREVTERACSPLRIIFEEPQILSCGVVCSMFEASMFIFVVNWTPSLEEPGVKDPPFGHIFTTFMIMCMLGSGIFSVLSRGRSIEVLGFFIIALAAVSNSILVFTSDRVVRFLCFLIFEMTVGMYFPFMGTLKGAIVPEGIRTATYSLFRVPLNIAVLVTLLSTSRMRTSFAVTALLLSLSCIAQLNLLRVRTEAAISYAPISSQLEEDLELRSLVGKAMEMDLQSVAEEDEDGNRATEDEKS